MDPASLSVVNDPPSRWAAYASHIGSYMRRWILRTPFGTLRIHNIRRSDAGRDFHDHPFHFWSLILRGGYIEHRLGCRCACGVDDSWRASPWCRHYGPGSLVRRRAADFHRLELVGGPAWTFVVSSRKVRSWGFLLSDGRWIPHGEYREHLRNLTAARA